MISLLLSLLLFVFFTLVGRAVLLLLPRLHQTLLGWLLAPAVGLSLVLLLTTYLNQAGQSVESFGRLLGAGLGLLAIILLHWSRDRLRCDGLWLFFGLLVGALIYAGWPALLHGFNWVSFANDDMANYCLGASRHLHNGFYRVPTLQELGGSDYSQYYWFMHVGGLVRFGSDLLLAWVSSLTSLSPVAIFMPTVLALGMIQISSAAALASLLPGRRKYALVVAGLLAVSPLSLLGIYYQLIAQVAGLGLLLAVGALLFAPPPSGWREGLGWLLVTGLCSATLCLTYPEVTPFIGLAYLLYLFLTLWHRPKIARRRLAWSIAAGVLCVLFLRENVLSYGITLLNQYHGAIVAVSEPTYLFPYFLLPAGLASFQGLMPLEQAIREPYGSALIIGGALLLLAVLAQTARLAFYRHAFGCVLAVMLLLGVTLFLNKNDFGLFKLVMFAQPALAGVLATLFLAKRRFWPAILAGLLLLQIPTAWHYADISLGQKLGSFAALPGASEHSVTAASVSATGPLTSDIHHIVAAKLGALAFQGTSLVFFSRDFFAGMESLVDHASPYRAAIARWHPHASVILSAKNLFVERNAQKWKDAKLFTSDFKLPQWNEPLAGPVAMLQMPREPGIFNGLVPAAPNSDTFFHTASPPAPANWLAFINSTKGEHYYLAQDRHLISYYQPESDSYNPQAYFAALGRFLLLRVENPSEQLYVRVSATKSLLGTGRTGWPGAARVRGEQDAQLNFVGAGAGNIFAGPLRPIKLEGHSYVAVDFGEDGQQFPIVRHGLLNAYNSKVALDPRYIVAYGRDISCLSVEQYQALDRPRQLQSFPTDLLGNPALEFSGWFEDGWISQHSYAVLAGTISGDRLRLKGMVPGIGKLLASGQRLEVRVNGASVHSGEIKPGTFDLLINLPPEIRLQHATRVELDFFWAETLPAPDDRPVAAKIDFLGLVRD